MEHHRSLESVALRDSWLTIGVFDGVHRGHQEILKNLTAGARAVGAPAVVLTFYPHPAVVLRKQTDFKYLTLPEERAGLLADLGVDVVITLPFTPELAVLSAREFMSEVRDHLAPRRLWVGYDFALGRNREGNYERLAVLGRELGYEVCALNAVTNGAQVVSSSLIRARLAAGEVAEAARALGRPYAVSGPVVHGDGRGKKINIPTANIDYPREKVIPANGVYACWAWVQAERRKAVTNVGVRPTFTPEEQRPHVEAHLLDFNGELYDQELRLEFVARLRHEMRFPSVTALIEQIQRDSAHAARMLS